MADFPKPKMNNDLGDESIPSEADREAQADARLASRIQSLKGRKDDLPPRPVQPADDVSDAGPLVDTRASTGPRLERRTHSFALSDLALLEEVSKRVFRLTDEKPSHSGVLRGLLRFVANLSDGDLAQASRGMKDYKPGRR